MTTQEVAQRLVEMNRQDLHMEIYEELYDTENILSVENWGDRMEFKGMDAIKQKGEQWFASIAEVHEMRTSDPLVADKSFAVTFYMDVTFNENSDMPGRSQTTELAVYHVNDDGKIYQEEFFA